MGPVSPAKGRHVLVAGFFWHFRGFSPPDPRRNTPKLFTDFSLEFRRFMVESVFPWDLPSWLGGRIRDRHSALQFGFF